MPRAFIPNIGGFVRGPERVKKSMALPPITMGNKKPAAPLCSFPESNERENRARRVASHQCGPEPCDCRGRVDGTVAFLDHIPAHFIEELKANEEIGPNFKKIIVDSEDGTAAPLPDRGNTRSLRSCASASHCTRLVGSK